MQTISREPRPFCALKLERSRTGWAAALSQLKKNITKEKGRGPQRLYAKLLFHRFMASEEDKNLKKEDDDIVHAL